MRRMRLYLLTQIAIADTAKISFWAILEADIGVICACTPRVYILLLDSTGPFIQRVESSAPNLRASHVAITGGSDAQRLEFHV
jgi:hypothetical protein